MCGTFDGAPAAAHEVWRRGAAIVGRDHSLALRYIGGMAHVPEEAAAVRRLLPPYDARVVARLGVVRCSVVHFRAAVHARPLCSPLSVRSRQQDLLRCGGRLCRRRGGRLRWRRRPVRARGDEESERSHPNYSSAGDRNRREKWMAEWAPGHDGKARTFACRRAAIYSFDF